MIALTDIFVKYGDRELLSKVNLTIKEKDKIGLVGRNGAGKSTMLKIISGTISPHGGNISRPNGTTLGFLHQELSLPTGSTVMDETMKAFEEAQKVEKLIDTINEDLSTSTDYETQRYMNLIQDLSDANDRFTALGGLTMEADVQKILTGLGFKESDMHRQTEEFSGGWKMRIELAKMLLQRPDYLLLDEPTNHLDIESIIWLEQFLSTYEGVVITISHDKMFLDNVTKRTVEIELGNLYDYKANYSRYTALRAERREKLQSTFENQQKAIAQKERTISRFMAKATKTKMAQSMQKQLDKLERVEIAEEDTKVMKLYFPPAPRSGRIAVEAKNVVKHYGDLEVLNNIDITIERGERISFVGQNGQGKTTLSKLLIDIEKASSGEITLGHNSKIGYYAQNQADTLDLNATALEVMKGKASVTMRTKVRSILGAFMFSGDDAGKKVKVLSGGERARLALACMLLEPFNLLVLDEPTNHLDMLSKEVLKNAIMEYDGTLIVVSHDREFLNGLTTRTIEFRDKKLYEYLGDVNYFLEKRALENMREAEKMTVVKAEKKKAVEAKPAASASKLSNDEIKKITRSIQNIERKISNKENDIKQLETEMAKDNFYQSSESEATLKKYNTIKSDIDQLMEEWEKLEAQMV